MVTRDKLSSREINNVPEGAKIEANKGGFVPPTDPQAGPWTVPSVGFDNQTPEAAKLLIAAINADNHYAAVKLKNDQIRRQADLDTQQAQSEAAAAWSAWQKAMRESNGLIFEQQIKPLFRGR